MKLNLDRIDLELARKCLTVTDLCKKAGVAYPSYAQIRAGKATPKPVTVGKLATALGLDPVELLEKNAL